MSERLRIGLDLRSGQEAWLGGLYYLRNLILAVRSLPEPEQPELLGFAPADDPSVRDEAFTPLLTVTRFRAGDPRGTLPAKMGNRLRCALKSRAETPFGVDRAARENRADVLFPTLKSHVRGTTAHLPWVYDLQHLDQPNHFSRSERSFRNRAFRRAARSAPLIVVSSEVAARAFAARYPHSAEKLRVLRFTTVLEDGWLDSDPRQVAETYGLTRAFAIFPGQFWVHKSHETALEAVRLLRDKQTDVCLVCTGATSDYRFPGHFERLKAFIEDHGLGGRVRVLGIVPRQDYVQLLRAAQVVVQPSLYEGWSSVVEDARAFGKRMVLSDLPVHKEQAPEGALYFPQRDPEALAACLKQSMGLAPQVVGECEAAKQQAERVASYGRRFVSIAREAAESR